MLRYVVIWVVNTDAALAALPVSQAFCEIASSHILELPKLSAYTKRNK